MNKHDTVIGYIEYLDCNGCVRERIPYVDAEKFKTRIYASLYCGEPIIPVLFPENLSQPLLFEKGTIFPWGLRRKKYELLPYEIYQTNNREIAFLRYDYTKDHINAASYKLVYRGQMECWQPLDSLYCPHNQENRPNGRKMRSLSVSDIIVMHEDGQAHAYYVELDINRWMTCCRGWNKPRNAALHAKNDNKISSAKENTPISELDFLYWFFYHEIIHISFVDFFMVIRYNT